MKFCPRCGAKLVSNTKSCPDCGIRPDGDFSFFDQPRDYWLTLIGAIGLLLLFFLNWVTIKIPDYFNNGNMKSYGFNLYSITTKFSKISDLLDVMRLKANELAFVRSLAELLLALSIIAFALLAVSLICYRHKNRAAFALVGFGVFAAVYSVFIVYIIYLNYIIAESAGGFIKLSVSFSLLIALFLSIGTLLFIDSKNYGARRRRLKAFAKVGLRGRILASFGACLIPGLVTWGLRLFPSDLYAVNLFLFDEIVIGVSLFMMVISFVASVFITGPLDAGLSGYFIRLLANEKNPPSALSVCDCFGAGYVRLSAGMLAYKATAFFAAAVPLVLLLLPGMFAREIIEGIEVYRVASTVWPVALLSVALYIYVETSLSMVPYILINDPKPSVRETLFESYRMTRGHVLELLIMQFSFLLWLSIVALSFFIGMLYVYPYIEATCAAYYLELSGWNRRGSDEAAHEN